MSVKGFQVPDVLIRIFFIFIVSPDVMGIDFILHSSSLRYF